MDNDFELAYEKKGVDYWWVITIQTEMGLFTVGRGIVPDTLWDDFTDLFDQSKHSKLWWVERKL